jgi:hypothetical protein
LDAAGVEIAGQAKELALAMSKHVRAASNGLNFYIDPKLAQNFNINLHMMEENDSEKEKTAYNRTEKVAEGKPENGNFMEETFSFPSKKQADSNYMCSVVLQKPEDKLYCVSVYMIESYLGRFAFKANFYFRDGSRRAAEKCYLRAARAVKELKQDVMEDDVLQTRVPWMMRKRLAGMEGEIEPKVNKVALYLDPANVASEFDPEKQFSTYTPTRRSVTDDLILKD